MTFFFCVNLRVCVLRLVCGMLSGVRLDACATPRIKEKVKDRERERERRPFHKKTKQKRTPMPRQQLRSV